MIKMIAGAMEALKVGDTADLATELGPVIDEDAKRLLDEHLVWLDENAKRICRLPLSSEAAHGSFIAPALYEISALGELNRENFGPILHVIRFAGDRLRPALNDLYTPGYWINLRRPNRVHTA